MKLAKAAIESIINYEVVVDCYTEEEANMGWAIYMEKSLNYPFGAEYLVRKKSGENQWRKVSVIKNKTDESSFDGGPYYVDIELDDIIISVSIDELRNIKGDETTIKALQVWRYRGV